MTKCQKSRLQTPHWYGFAEAPYTGMRPDAFCSDIAQMVERQIHNLLVAGSNPAIHLVATGPFSAIRS
jgi:hypothetical protein